MNLSSLHSKQSGSTIKAFFSNPVWAEIEGILKEQIELERDSLELHSDLNAIIESQASISSMRLLLTLPVLMTPSGEENGT